MWCTAGPCEYPGGRKELHWPPYWTWRCCLYAAPRWWICGSSSSRWRWETSGSPLLSATKPKGQGCHQRVDLGGKGSQVRTEKPPRDANREWWKSRCTWSQLRHGGENTRQKTEVQALPVTSWLLPFSKSLNHWALVSFTEEYLLQTAILKTDNEHERIMSSMIWYKNVRCYNQLSLTLVSWNFSKETFSVRFH